MEAQNQIGQNLRADVWRAMEWAKPDGQIAFALHARPLPQQGDGMPVARQDLFVALDVIGFRPGV